ncbi:hypothetical protein BKA70DRAFT_1224191 [Coprinopsis sp. MPI-PUGE-AT-0042]|nr:hypothetical protein BKA70DRAFT_1224191 [Coprinopsis sp. MPI-PUGE-AT-0042]
MPAALSPPTTSCLCPTLALEPPPETWPLNTVQFLAGQAVTVRQECSIHLVSVWVGGVERAWLASNSNIPAQYNGCFSAHPKSHSTQKNNKDPKLKEKGAKIRLLLAVMPASCKTWAACFRTPGANILQVTFKPEILNWHTVK